MRAIRVSFSAEMLLAEGGLDKKILMQILDLMPPDARVIGFREHSLSMNSDIYLTSKHFKLMPDKYAQVPNVSIVLQTDAIPNGYVTYVSGIDFNDTLETHWKPLEEQETIKVTSRVPGNITSVPVNITIPDIAVKAPVEQEHDDTEVLYKLWGIRRR